MTASQNGLLRSYLDTSRPSGGGYIINGHLVNEKQILRLMRLMGLMPIYHKPNTSGPSKGHKTYP